MSGSGQFRICRRCGQRTYDFDVTEREWFCGECDDWADT